MECQYCHSTDYIKRGKKIQCRECGRYTRKKDYFPKIKKIKNGNSAKVLVFDIETLPMEAYIWRLWDKVTSPKFIKRDWCVLSYAGKWLFEAEHFANVLTPQDALDHNDGGLVSEIWDIFNEADIIIAHNGDRFDMPKMNARFVYYRMKPPRYYSQIDTCKTARNAFNFSSNSLDYLGEYLGLGTKDGTDFELWKSCAEGDKAALQRMLDYNVRDIFLLEDVYVELRPWIQHPNMGLYVSTDNETPYCPVCASPSVRWEGEYHTSAGVFETFRCNDCGSIGRNHKRRVTTKARSVR